MKNLASSDSTRLGKPRPWETIIPGGIVVGILDMLFAFTYYGWYLGAKPLRIFQSVAGGVLGRPVAIDGGVRTFALGLALHFVVATCITTVFYFASLWLPVLLRYPWVSGPLYGIVAFLGMNYVVVPLSAIRRFPGPITRVFWVGMIGHMVLVGLPIALLARRSARAHRS
jgi:hypothetical protein